MFKKSAGSGTEPTPKAVKRRLFWQKARRRTLIGLAVFFVAHTALNLYASVQLNRELGAIRQKNEPVMFYELEPPPVADAQNAALVYEQASKALKLMGPEKFALRFDTPEERALIIDAIRKNKKALDLTRKAGLMPLCRFDMDWHQDPFKLKFDYYKTIREQTRFLADAARIEAENGNSVAALQDVRVLFGISDHLSHEPFYIGYLVAQSLDQIAHQTLGEVLEKTPLTEVQAHAFQKSLPATDWNGTFRQSMLSERTLSTSVYSRLGYVTMNLANNSDEGPSLTTQILSFIPLYIARPFLKLDQVASLRIWKKVIDSTEVDKIPIHRDADSVFLKAIEETPRYAVLTRTLMPVFSSIGVARDNAEVRRRQREIGLALTCYRTLKGQYPATLQPAEKLWDQPFTPDVYSGKPFVYRLEKDGFLLYSVGANGMDNGGKGKQGLKTKDSKLEDDIVWGGRRE